MEDSAKPNNDETAQPDKKAAPAKPARKAAQAGQKGVARQGQPRQGAGQGQGPGQVQGNGGGSGGQGQGQGRGQQGKQRSPQARQQARPVEVKPLAGRTRPRRRHFFLLLSMLLMVAAPAGTVAWYLYTVAVDQYASTVGFSVRKEETNSAVDILGTVTSLSGSSSSDTDILYEYIQSQEMVETVQSRLDLRQIYSKPENDPVFAMEPDVPIEDLVKYWQKMVKIYYDSSTGLIELRVLAFDPKDAQAVAQAIVDESSRMINDISAIARDDSTRYAREELDRAVERLKKARKAITEFRSRNQIVDPSADIQGQMGLLTNLQGQLAEALIEQDLLRDTTREGDPRLSQAQRRIEVITLRIEEERKKLGVGASGTEGRDYATIVAEYESLSVDREFAEQTYTSALTAFDAAQNEAQRQSRYLGLYLRPTLAETAQYPQRELLVALTAAFAFLAWSVLALIFYSIRDRR